MNSLITITNLTIKYDNRTIIENFNLDINKPKIISIVGKSGVGKTSLLKAMLNLTDYHGEIFIKDDISLGYMPQSLSLFEELSCYKNIIIPKLAKKKKIEKKQINDLLHTFDLLDIRDKPVKEISGGQKSRIALLRSIVNDDKIILLDEPLSKLDELTKYDALNFLKKIQKKYNLTYIYISHDLNEVLQISDDIIVINDSTTYLENVQSRKLTKENILKLLK